MTSNKKIIKKTSMIKASLLKQKKITKALVMKARDLLIKSEIVSDMDKMFIKQTTYINNFNMKRNLKNLEIIYLIKYFEKFLYR